MSDSIATSSERILVFALFGADAALTQEFLSSANIASDACADVDALCAALGEGVGAVVMAEEALVPAATDKLIRALDAQPPWSDIPIIVSAAESAYFATGVVGALGEHANVTLLQRPVRLRSLLSAVRHALRARRRQHEMRALLGMVEASEARFRQVQERAPYGLILLRPLRGDSGAIEDFAWIYTNPTAEAAIGRSHAELLGNRMRADVPSAVAAGHFDAHVRAFETGEALEWEATSARSGAPATYRTLSFRLDGDLAVLFEDVTARRAAEEERARLLETATEARERAEVSSRAKDEFLATVSHELRTPLNAMLGWARMASSGRLDEAKSRRAMETIERNAIAQARLIEDLLDVSRIVAGKLRLERHEVDLLKVVGSAVETVRPTLEARELSFALRVPDGAVRVLGDANRLQQVIWNLLSNAAKFTPKGGSVSVDVTEKAGDVQVSVRDTGSGIEAAFLPRLFHRFQQADAGPARLHGGLGLGLAIARHLVELHGGAIEATSDGVGRGATFSFRVPAAPKASAPVGGDGAADTPLPNVARPPELVGLRVLVVEDGADARDLLMELVVGAGGVALGAASAAEGWARLRAEPPDVILSDVSMPDEDGYAFIRRVRALPPEQGGRTPAAAVTAYARAEDRLRALNAGFELHMAKPVDPTRVVQLLVTLARMARAMKEVGG